MMKSLFTNLLFVVITIIVSLLIFLVCLFLLISSLKHNEYHEKKLYRVANCMQWRLFASFSKQLSTKLFAFVYTKITHRSLCVWQVVCGKTEGRTTEKLQARWWMRGYYPLSPALVPLRLSFKIKMTVIRAVEIPFLGLSQCQAERRQTIYYQKELCHDFLV